MWATLLASIYLAVRGYRGALSAGVAVLSHWILATLAHRPDLPLYRGARRHPPGWGCGTARSS
jgi:hypothetical protein